MNVFDIMPEALPSIEKLCLVAHATDFVASSVKRSFEKGKKEIIRCSVHCFMRSIKKNSVF